MPSEWVAPSEICGVGVDLLNLHRARTFFKRHGGRIQEKLFSKSEKKETAEKPLTSLGFAKKFTAKEAFFKTLNRSWLGLEGFASLEIQDVSKDRFRAKVVGSKTPCRIVGEGCYFKDKNFVGAQVIAWESAE